MQRVLLRAVVLVQVTVVVVAVADVHHHVVLGVLPGVHHLAAVVVQVDVAVVVLHTVGIPAVNNAQDHVVVVVICAKMYVLVVMGVVNNTAQAVQVLVLDNATILAKDTMIFKM